MSAASTRAPVRAALAVGLVAGSTLALQVLLTRIVSAALNWGFTVATLVAAACYAAAAGHARLGRWP
jgi:hypothetical protein